MISVRIHCTEKCRTTFHNDVLKKVSRDFFVFFHLYLESCILFSSPHIPDLTMPGYPHKASYFEYRLTIFLAAKIGPVFKNKLYGQQLSSL